MSLAFEETTAPVTRTQIVRFAGAAGDYNPMHHDEPFAQAAGQPTVFAMGQLTAAILGEAVARWLGRENVTSFAVRFKDKVWPGDVLVLRGADTDPPAAEGERVLVLTVVREADGVEVLSGVATART